MDAFVERTIDEILEKDPMLSDPSLNVAELDDFYEDVYFQDGDKENVLPFNLPEDPPELDPSTVGGYETPPFTCPLPAPGLIEKPEIMTPKVPVKRTRKASADPIRRRKAAENPVMPKLCDADDEASNEVESLMKSAVAKRAKSVQQRLDEVAANDGEVTYEPKGKYYWLFTIEKSLRYTLCDNCVKMYLKDDDKITEFENGYVMLNLMLCPSCVSANNDVKRAWKQGFGKKWEGGSGGDRRQLAPLHTSTSLYPNSPIFAMKLVFEIRELEDIQRAAKSVVARIDHFLDLQDDPEGNKPDIYPDTPVFHKDYPITDTERLWWHGLRQTLLQQLNCIDERVGVLKSHPDYAYLTGCIRDYEKAIELHHAECEKARDNFDQEAYNVAETKRSIARRISQAHKEKLYTLESPPGGGPIKWQFVRNAREVPSDEDMDALAVSFAKQCSLGDSSEECNVDSDTASEYSAATSVSDSSGREPTGDDEKKDTA